MGRTLLVVGLAVGAAIAIARARYGWPPDAVVVLSIGWSAGWFAVGALARRRTHPLGASMMLFGISELIALAAEAYAGASPMPTVLRAFSLAIHSLQFAWMAYMAMTMLRLRASPRTARTRAAVTWTYGVAYTTGILTTTDPLVRGLLAAGWAVLLGTLVMWMAARWLGSPARLRRVRIVPTLVAIVTGSLALVLTVDAARRGRPVWAGSLLTASPAGAVGAVGATTFWLFLAVIPGSFLFGLVRERLALGRVADLVPRLGALAVRELEPALADVLGDPRLRLVVGGPSAPRVPPGRVASEVVDGVWLVHDPSVLAERRLLDAVRSAVALAIEREALQRSIAETVEQVRTSGARLAHATLEERRRIERDLHDGAQQRLLAVGMTIQHARTHLHDASALTRALDEAATEIAGTLTELRELARGLRPALLAEQGLAAAIPQLAQRASLPVRCEMHADARLPDQIEATVYFAVSEALQNAVKHANAAQAWVTVMLRPGHVEVEVRDDGIGGAQPRTGSGLHGLADRLAAVGGLLTITSPPGHGTVVSAEIPLPVAPAGSQSR